MYSYPLLKLNILSVPNFQAYREFLSFFNLALNLSFLYEEEANLGNFYIK